MAVGYVMGNLGDNDKDDDYGAEFGTHLVMIPKVFYNMTHSKSQGFWGGSGQ